MDGQLERIIGRNKGAVLTGDGGRPRRPATGGELDYDRLSYDDALRSRIAANLAAHPRAEIADGTLRRAAVAVVVVDSSPGDERFERGGPAFLVGRRAPTLTNHGGQWALPGGRVEPGESPEQAALRELHEELGLLLGPAAVVGRLDDYGTRSGFVITPVVVWAGTGAELRPDPDEVASIYRVDLRQLAAPGSPRYLQIPESDRPVVQVPIGDVSIHAPTGAVLLQFRWVALEGRHGERVDDLEQPVFAWR